MSGILLALTASLAWGAADFGAGFGARRVAVAVVLLVSQAAGLALVGIAVLADGATRPSWQHLAWGAFAGVVGVAGLGSFYRALAVGTMGIVGPISAAGAVVPVAYGLARGERPSLLQGLGVALTIVGVVVASVEPSARTGGRRVGIGVGLALLAALGFGSSLVGLNRAAQGGALWATLSMRAAALPLILIAVLLLRPGTQGLRRFWPLLAAAGVADTSANLLYGLAATRGLVSVVSVLASLYPVVLVVLGRVVLAERIARPRLAGVGVALAGVALISAG